MRNISLPISKSIANRVLILLAQEGKDATSFARTDMPDDVRVLADALSLKETDITLELGNSGTSMRFLTAYFAGKEGIHAVLNCCERMKERPIGQLVDTLRQLGADIRYISKEGFPPLEIYGKKLKNKEVDIPEPLSTQFVSALLLIGKDVQTDSTSPYIEMTRQVMADYKSGRYTKAEDVERDWSSAAFFYEYLALHPEQQSCFFPHLSLHSTQGDKACAEMFAQLGIRTRETEGGILIEAGGKAEVAPAFNILNTPDLYPALAITCHQLGVNPTWTLPESLQIKESNRLAAIETILRHIDENNNQPLPTFDDHRLVMALLAADLPAEETDSISKSFPDFLQQLQAARLPLQKEEPNARTEAPLQKTAEIESTHKEGTAADSKYPHIEEKTTDSESTHKEGTATDSKYPHIEEKTTDSESTHKEGTATAAVISRLVAVRHGDAAPVFDDDIPTLIVDDEGHGKKWAIGKGMRTLRTSFVWLTDADIRFDHECSGIQIDKGDTKLHNPTLSAEGETNPLKEEENLASHDLLIGTLWMEPAHELPTLLDRLQSIEYAAIQAITRRKAQAGKAIMCAGANMIVRREAWLECEADIHPELPSGDDMFLLESMKKRGKKTGVFSAKAYCTAAPTLRSLLRQRMRWAGKASAYTDRDIIRYGTLTIVSNLLVVLCPVWGIIKWLLDMQLAKEHYARYEQTWSTRLSLDALLLTYIYPWYMLICLIGGMARKHRW